MDSFAISIEVLMAVYLIPFVVELFPSQSCSFCIFYLLTGKAKAQPIQSFC